MKFAGTNNPDSLDNYARTDDNSMHRSFPVGTKKPNSLGLYDMSGNVFEWIGAYYQFYPEEGNPPKWDNLEERWVRIIRGGSFEQSRSISSTYWRVGMLKDATVDDVGFRCVAPLKNK